MNCSAPTTHSNYTAMDNKLTTVTAATAPSLVDVRMDATTYPRIGQMAPALVVRQITPIVLQAFMYRGQTADGTLVDFTAKQLVEELLADEAGAGLRGLTVYEIQRAIRKAVLGQTSREMYGVNVASLYAVLVDYAKGEGHIADKQAQDIRRNIQPCRSVAALMDAAAGAMLKNSNPFSK